jgi:hypothetical protein
VYPRYESVFPFDIGRESAKFPGQLIIPFRVSDWQEDFVRTPIMADENSPTPQKKKI